MVPELVRGFDFSLALGGVEGEERSLEVENLWFVKQTNLFVRVRVREE